MGAGNHPRTKTGRERGPRHGGQVHHGGHHDPHPGRAHHNGETSAALAPPNTPTHTTEANIGRHTGHTSARPPATGTHTENGGHTYTGSTGHTHRGSRRERRRTAHHHALTTRRRPRPGTGRGRNHGRGTHGYGPPEDTGPRHRPPGRATPRTVTRPHHGLEGPGCVTVAV